MKKILVASIVSLALAIVPLSATPASALSWSDFFGGSSSAQTATQPAVDETDDEHPCLRATNHEYEVCTAYIANASAAVLVPYYKYANSTDGWQRFSTYRLSSRYVGDAYMTIQDRTASWPSGVHEVSVPDIHIVSVDSDLADNTATVVTRESWKVTDQTGQIIYQEMDQSHTITMQRVPSYVLHKWVVTNIQ